MSGEDEGRVAVGRSRYHRVVEVDGRRFMACQAGKPWKLLITMAQGKAEALGYRPCSRCYGGGIVLSCDAGGL